MDLPADKSVDDAVSLLVSFDTIKVWSWLTTIFGDLARQPGDELSGAVLSALTERIGIKPEAMRVALHRLRKDNWIVTRKDGRNSFYSLTESARAETLEASQRIYAKEVEVPSHWHLIMTDPTTDTVPNDVTLGVERGDALRVTETCFLSADWRPVQSGEVLCLEVQAGDIPRWMMRAVVPADIDAGFQRLVVLLSKVETALARSKGSAPLDEATLRLLVLHHWRRHVLRCPPLIARLAAPEWVGSECRRISLQFLDRLPASAPGALSASPKKGEATAIA